MAMALSFDCIFGGNDIIEGKLALRFCYCILNQCSCFRYIHNV